MVFDGSSTKQAEGGSSDCGTRSYPDPTRINGYLVMTEVMHADGTPFFKRQSYD
jgi:glutamine synthetase